MKYHCELWITKPNEFLIEADSIKDAKKMVVKIAPKSWRYIKDNYKRAEEIKRKKDLLELNKTIEGNIVLNSTKKRKQ
jgi:hypothetical protein